MAKQSIGRMALRFFFIWLSLLMLLCQLSACTEKTAESAKAAVVHYKNVMEDRFPISMELAASLSAAGPNAVQKR